jgi:hypothetical protein
MLTAILAPAAIAYRRRERETANRHGQPEQEANAREDGVA